MIMSLRLAVLKNVFDSYSESAYSLVFLFIGIIYLILKDKKEDRNLLIYEIFGILLLVTPFIGNKIVTLGAGNGSNWPVYGMLCAIPLTAYVAVDICRGITVKKEQYVFLAVFLVVIQLGLGISATGEQFNWPLNWKKTSVTAQSIAKELDAATEWYVMAPKKVAAELREYDDSIRVFYEESYEDLQKDLELLQKEAEFYGCNCVILDKVYDDAEVMLADGYEKLVETDAYIVYEK